VVQGVWGDCGECVWRLREYVVDERKRGRSSRVDPPPHLLSSSPPLILALGVRLALYPGTFDPITLGHLDVLERALAVFDRVEVVVAVNDAKTPLFPLEERLRLIRESVAGITGGDRVEVASFEGLLVDHARARGATALVRGLRQVSDFDFEFRMALANRRLAPEVQTVFLMPGEAHAFLAASLVREIHRWGGDTSSFVPAPVQRALELRQVASD
jgi:pantetheine-phosphate adenylyltransferase